jgi:hypothetical protein
MKIREFRSRSAIMQRTNMHEAVNMIRKYRIERNATWPDEKRRASMMRFIETESRHIPFLYMDDSF